MKTIAFVDAANIIYGAKAEGWFIELKKSPKAISLTLEV